MRASLDPTLVKPDTLPSTASAGSPGGPCGGLPAEGEPAALRDGENTSCIMDWTDPPALEMSLERGSVPRAPAYGIAA